MNNTCKQLARNLFFLGQFKQYVGTHCRKMFFQADLPAHINYASTLWSNASEVHLKKKKKKKEKNSPYGRAAMLILLDHSPSTTAKTKQNKTTTTTTTKNSNNNN